MAAIRANATLEMDWIGSCPQHRFIVIRFEDYQVGLGNRPGSGRRPTSKVGEHGHGPAIAAQVEPARLSCVMAHMKSCDLEIRQNLRPLRPDLQKPRWRYTCGECRSLC